MLEIVRKTSARIPAGRSGSLRRIREPRMSKIILSDYDTC